MQENEEKTLTDESDNENEIENLEENDELAETSGAEEENIEADEEQNGGHNPRRQIKKSSRFNYYIMDDEMSFITCMDDDEPLTYDDAMASSDWRKWNDGMKAEMSALEENKTWDYVNSDSVGENKVIECKWVFKKKENNSGVVTRFKARLVVKGYQQKEMSISDIYSPVAKLPSIRIFLALCNNFDMKIHQLDVCSAFLYGDIKEDVYICLPKGFDGKEGSICKLRKSLYGLKNSPKNWNDKFYELMIKLSFVRSEYEYCLYIKVTDTYKIYVLIYVDDLLLAGTNEKEIENMIQILNFKNF